MKRNKHSLSHYVLSAFNMGVLIPVANFEVLPGDSIRMATSALIRMSPLMAPVMHPVQIRLHAWYVPYRVIWPNPEGWEDFITGGPDGIFEGTYPTVQASAVGGVTSVYHYLGIPNNSSPGVNLSALPARAYNKIYNENYRDEDLCPEVDVNTSFALQRIAWEKDRFTSARPWTQKGPAVSMPLGVSAPVIGAGTPQVGDVTRKPRFSTSNAEAVNVQVSVDASEFIKMGGAVTTPQTVEWGDQTGLIADLGSATAAQVNDLRKAMALQRYQEARAQYGHRYSEYLRYLGVKSSDARLQRPEYLGGGKATISFSEVLRTATTAADTAPVGDMSGHGIAGVRTRPFVRFFEEHGIVMMLASVRPRSMYVNGIHRSWSRRTKEDYWQKELELIGQDAVQNQELYSEHAVPGATFGYNDRYSDYRHLPSYVCGDFRTTLSDWHMARQFGAAPALNQAFVECDPGFRFFAEQTNAHKMWCMFSHSIQARRMVTKRTIGRIM